MTIRFAAARGSSAKALIGLKCCSAPLDAANDNGPSLNRLARLLRRQLSRKPAKSLALRTPPLPLLTLARNRTPRDDTPTGNPMLAEALRHFARHGMAAASHARTEALTALEARDEAGFLHWLGVCRQLDRGMAEACERQALAPA